MQGIYLLEFYWLSGLPSKNDRDSRSLKIREPSQHVKKQPKRGIPDGKEHIYMRLILYSLGPQNLWKMKMLIPGNTWGYNLEPINMRENLGFPMVTIALNSPISSPPNAGQLCFRRNGPNDRDRKSIRGARWIWQWKSWGSPIPWRIFMGRTGWIYRTFLTVNIDVYGI